MLINIVLSKGYIGLLNYVFCVPTQNYSTLNGAKAKLNNNNNNKKKQTRNGRLNNVDTQQYFVSQASVKTEEDF